MAYKISVSHNKGGVGKTNEVINLAVFLVTEHGLRVRIVDLDPQSDASAALGFEVRSEEDGPTVLNAIERAYVRQKLVTGTAIDCIYPCRWDVPWKDKLTFIPSRYGLEEAQHIAPTRDAFLRLRAAMEGTDVDVVIFDCPPSLGVLPQLAWADSDDVLLITQPSFRSYRSMARTHSCSTSGRTSSSPISTTPDSLSMASGQGPKTTKSGNARSSRGSVLAKTRASIGPRCPYAPDSPSSTTSYFP